LFSLAQAGTAAFVVVIADALVACMSALLFCCAVVWITELVRVKKVGN